MKKQLTTLALAALALPAFAATTEDFSAYRIADSVTTGQTLGADTQGWLGGWRTSSDTVETIAEVTRADPLDQGPYLQIGLTSSPNQPRRPSGAVSRPYAPPKEPFTVSFRYRPDTLDNQCRYTLFDNNARASGTATTASWQIEILNGRWRLIDGNPSGGTETYIDTGFPAVAGKAYSIKISIDPAKRRWSVVIVDDAHTFRREGLNFRTAAFGDERWVHFGANELASPSTGISARISIDSITITPDRT